MKEGSKYTAYDQFSYEQKEAWLRDMSERMGHAVAFLYHNFGMSFQEIIDAIDECGYWKCWEYVDHYDYCGKMSAEIAYMIADYFHIEKKSSEPHGFDKAYWFGWFVTWAMYRGRLGFQEIFSSLRADDVADMYNVYHEMSIMTGIEDLKKKIADAREASGGTMKKDSESKQGRNGQELY